MNLQTYEYSEETPECRYISLDVMSDFSIGESIAHIPDLVNKAKSLNMKALTLTDRTLSGTIEFYQLCKQNNIKPIIGQKIAFGNNEVNLLCKDLEAYQILCRHSLEFQNSNNKPIIVTELPILKEEAAHFICTAHFSDVKLYDLFGDNLYTQIDFSDLKSHPESIEKQDTSKYVITNPVRFIGKEDADALAAMKLYLNTSVEVAPENYFMDDTEILPFLETINHPELLENLWLIEKQISFVFPENYFTTIESNKRMHERLPYFENSVQTLRQLAYDSFEAKKDEFEDINAAKDRLEYELNDISSQHWEKIFLLQQELVSWCSQNGIEHGPGRGSAPGSLLSYLLGITGINPLEHGLLYERFVNPECLCYPDFDIDYDYERLDEVVNHLVEDYGTDNVVRIISYATLKCQQVLKIAGKFLDYPDEEIQLITNIILNCGYPRLSFSNLLDSNSYIYKDGIPRWEGVKLQEFFRDKKNERLIRIARCLESIKCNKGLHATGYIVTKAPLSQYVPVLKDDKSNRLYSEYTTETIDFIGLYKNDLLGLKQLTKLKQLSDEIVKNEKVEFDYKAIPIEDESTIAAFAKGSTTNIFQFESSGMKKVLKEFKPKSFSDLVLMNAMYRPGPMNYIHTIIENKAGYPHRNDFPNCEDILKESYGLPFYQEQIMQIAQKIADYTLGEADKFRRDLGKKKPEVLIAKKEEFVEKAVQKGIVSENQAVEIFEKLVPFTDYAFNKSHAVSYTLMAWWEMYIKVHYRKEYDKVIDFFTPYEE